MPDETVEKMRMIPAHSIEVAMVKAKQVLCKNDVKVVAVPDGISVMVKKAM